MTVVALSAGGASPASVASDSAIPTAPVLAPVPPDTTEKLGTGGGTITSAAPGQSIPIEGDGYAPYSTVTITIYSSPTVLAVVPADANGHFMQAVTVPAGLPAGTHSFVAAGVDPDGNPFARRLDLPIVAAGNEVNLPVTGPAVVLLIIAGFTVTMLGAALRSVRRHRPRHRA
ncbi:MAG TPA: hypothetical protein VFW27_24645 [Actinoplanes sp.]|nr:hypothetical protein [Actinoplanes sp.]